MKKKTVKTADKPKKEYPTPESKKFEIPDKEPEVLYKEPENFNKESEPAADSGTTKITDQSENESVIKESELEDDGSQNISPKIPVVEHVADRSTIKTPSQSVSSKSGTNDDGILLSTDRHCCLTKILSGST